MCCFIYKVYPAFCILLSCVLYDQLNLLHFALFLSARYIFDKISFPIIILWFEEFYRCFLSASEKMAQYMKNSLYFVFSMTTNTLRKSYEHTLRNMPGAPGRGNTPISAVKEKLLYYLHDDIYVVLPLPILLSTRHTQ